MGFSVIGRAVLTKVLILVNMSAVGLLGYTSHGNIENAFHDWNSYEMNTQQTLQK